MHICHIVKRNYVVRCSTRQMQINLVYEKLIRKILSGLNCSYFVQISLQIKSQAEIDEF